MDKTQAQKVALSTAHMPTKAALVYDMGFGTGLGSFALSQLYPDNTIIGVDIDPNAIKHASRYKAPNLSFETADISVVHFPGASADVIFCSSILHEVLSYASSDRFDLKHLENVFDVVSRPGQTTDFLAYHEDPTRKEITILVKAGYPRPILNASKKGHNLDNSTTGGYTLETVTATLPETADALATFTERTGLKESQVAVEGHNHPPYFPSPGTSDEAVEARRVRLAQKPQAHVSGENYSQLSTSGDLRGLDSRQTLRAFQVGGMSDPRLEINIYRLHLERAVSVGTWIGASLQSSAQDLPAIIQVE
jgi:SAM-dependent methyltransferase